MDDWFVVKFLPFYSYDMKNFTGPWLKKIVVACKVSCFLLI